MVLYATEASSPVIPPRMHFLVLPFRFSSSRSPPPEDVYCVNIHPHPTCEHDTVPEARQRVSKLFPALFVALQCRLPETSGKPTLSGYYVGMVILGFSTVMSLTCTSVSIFATRPSSWLSCLEQEHNCNTCRERPKVRRGLFCRSISTNYLGYLAI